MSKRGGEACEAGISKEDAGEDVDEKVSTEGAGAGLVSMVPGADQSVVVDKR